jgi:hypothetical protein
MDAIIYCRTGDTDSEVMRDYLRDLSVGCRVRHIDDGDPGARREWEDLDGEVTPVITIDRTQIVRGLDRTRLENFIGWVGC